MYPLHIACAFNEPERVVQKLISLFADAAKQKDNDGKYPIQYVDAESNYRTVVDRLIW